MSAREVTRLICQGVSCLTSLVRGRGAPLPDGYLSVLLDALRPHFFALPAFAALAGGALASRPESWRVIAAAALAGLGWGVGQLVNDLLDREADSIDAPHRPAVRGALPEGPTMLFAMVLGLSIALGTALLHPQAVWLASSAAVLLVGYGPAKRLPLVGNLAHGALLAVATLIGAAAGSASQSLTVVCSRAAPSALLVCGWGMIYIESNYEKDRCGDKAAGCCTLPLILGIRASATLRALGTIAVGGWAYELGLLTSAVATLSMAAGVSLVLLSCLETAQAPTEHTALGAYRASVHGTGLCMLALACPALGGWGAVGLIGINAYLVERAFRRSANP